MHDSRKVADLVSMGNCVSSLAPLIQGGPRGQYSVLFSSLVLLFLLPNHSPQLFSQYKGLGVSQLPSPKF